MMSLIGKDKAGNFKTSPTVAWPPVMSDKLAELTVAHFLADVGESLSMGMTPAAVGAGAGGDVQMTLAGAGAGAGGDSQVVPQAVSEDTKRSAAHVRSDAGVFGGLVSPLPPLRF